MSKNPRIFPINTGWLEADLGTYIFSKGPAGKKIWNPVICFYVATDDHKILVDTGLCDEARATKYHHKCDKRGCPEAPQALKAMGVDPDDIDIVLLTHLHWDHVQNLKKFKNARFVCPDKELKWAYNPLPLYYRSYEAGILGIEAPFLGVPFEVVDGEQEIVPGVSVFPSPGHSPGHQCVIVKTSVGDIVLAGDAIFQGRNLEPNLEEKWRYWVPARFVNSIEGWQSVEEIDKRADYVLAAHDEDVLNHSIYPFDGMKLRCRREVVPGAPFYFGGM
jgi:N-acyl homoserine lactone hydrolase